MGLGSSAIPFPVLERPLDRKPSTLSEGCEVRCAKILRLPLGEVRAHYKSHLHKFGYVSGSSVPGLLCFDKP